MLLEKFLKASSLCKILSSLLKRETIREERQTNQARSLKARPKPRRTINVLHLPLLYIYSVEQVDEY